MIRQFYLVLALSVVQFLGCGGANTSQKTPSSTNESTTTSMAGQAARPAASEQTVPAGETTDGNGLDAAVSAWQSDNKEEAVKLLLAARGDDLAKGSTLRVFQLTEDDVKNLSAAERNAFQQEFIKIAPILKQLSRHCLMLGDKSLENGEVDAARQHFEAAHRLGRTLEAPQRVVVLQSMGKALITSSQEGLARCESAGP
jgi:hypothetical protein